MPVVIFMTPLLARLANLSLAAGVIPAWCKIERVPLLNKAHLIQAPSN
jgi:hypothetical protein